MVIKELKSTDVEKSLHSCNCADRATLLIKYLQGKDLHNLLSSMTSDEQVDLLIDYVNPKLWECLVEDIESLKNMNFKKKRHRETKDG